MALRREMRLAASLLAAAIVAAGATAILMEGRMSSEAHRTDERPARQNRLASEKSPYLLQHADNAVDWYPWGEEAFEKALGEDKPIFLSIGYSTCHWCHVMEHESFEDPDVARLMNETFVSIKVDREERPDIDGVYMAVCQMMTGGGGWPLTIIMTPDKRPFFAATYIPKVSRRGRAGMVELIPYIGGLWANRREELLAHSDRVIAALRENSLYSPGEEPDESTLGLAYRQLAARFDEREGGFGTAPKFPTPHNLLFLLRYWKRTGEENALVMVEKTLQAMRRGGVFDQVGDGFHRYSTDARWLVPHFEKMLYDQALLAIAYIEAYQATQKEEYASTTREIFTYVLRDMTAPEGAFYSAEDADSEGEEGKFYLWTYEEITQLLSEGEAGLAVEAFNVERGGNYVDEVTGRRAGKNILHLSRSTHDLARERDLPIEEFHGRLEVIRRRLFEHRETRVRPNRDDKILTDWNGLMIAALAKGSRALSEPSYAEAARRAADFITAEMLRDGEHLLHRYRDGHAGIAGLLDDYAFFIWGLVELYEATFEVRYLETALALTRHLIEHFWDETDGGFFFAGDEGEELLVRQKESSDGALPSGNSVAMLNLVRLGRVIADADLEQKATEIGRAFSETVRPAPAAYTQLMAALDFAIGPTYEVVVVGRSNAEDTKAMLTALDDRFLPNKIVILRPLEEDEPAIDRHVEYARDYSSIDGKATAYICASCSCQLPTTEIGTMLQLLGEE